MILYRNLKIILVTELVNVEDRLIGGCEGRGWGGVEIGQIE